MRKVPKFPSNAYETNTIDQACAGGLGMCCMDLKTLDNDNIDSLLYFSCSRYSKSKAALAYSVGLGAAAAAEDLAFQLTDKACIISL